MLEELKSGLTGRLPVGHVRVERNTRVLNQARKSALGRKGERNKTQRKNKCNTLLPPTKSQHSTNACPEIQRMSYKNKRSENQ
ncbi:unnamed protein product [Clavelina lepadiformis]|uniref:Ribosomal protein S13 n=1 Tax=Clavelina lepadiformis TaxID=159417 RepID=A0ABP0FJK2_CLALP